MENILDILLWYQKNFRELPWRTTKDPYKIWLSEVILQQTQVKQGLAYYDKFVLKYPEVHDLARAGEEEVLKMWQGLGYYTRARNLHLTAKIISDQYQGIFPPDYSILSKLPGIGDYTASAILSFAYGKPYPVLDGNVFRLLSRLYDIHLPINEVKSRPVFKEILNSLIEGVNPSDFNNAIMELGAMICRPESPKCGECPVSMDCQARKKGTTALLPVKLKKAKHSIRHFNYLYIVDHDHFYLIKREGKDIWKNLYQLPLIESESEIDERFMEREVSSMLSKGSSFILDKQSVAKHLLTHQTIMATFWQLTLDKRPEFISGDYKKVNLKNYTKYPVPVLIENFLVSL
jgi:A/G-specific adenine glycosylase